MIYLPGELSTETLETMRARLERHEEGKAIAKALPAKPALSYWEECALQMIAETGPMYAGTGSSAIFDAAWALERRGLLVADYSKGPPYLTLTPAGKEALR